MEKYNKFSVMSLLFGILSIMFIFIGIIVGRLDFLGRQLVYELSIIIVILNMILPFFAILFGLMSLKSEKSKLSKIGISLGILIYISIIIDIILNMDRF